MKTIYAPLLLAVLSAATGCASDQWEGFVYPDKNDLTKHENIGIYETLDLCRASALNRLESYNALRRGDYECGLNCEYKDGWGSVKVCEETMR